MPHGKKQSWKSLKVSTQNKIDHKSHANSNLFERSISISSSNKYPNIKSQALNLTQKAPMKKYGNLFTLDHPKGPTRLFLFWYQDRPPRPQDGRGRSKVLDFQESSEAWAANPTLSSCSASQFPVSRYQFLVGIHGAKKRGWKTSNIWDDSPPRPPGWSW